MVDYNFKLAWDALKNRYENTRVLVYKQMKYFFGIHGAQNESAKALRLIQHGINDNLSILKSFVSTSYQHPISNTIDPAKEDAVNERRDITLFYIFNQGISTYQILQQKFKRMLIQNQSSRLQV